MGFVQCCCLKEFLKLVQKGGVKRQLSQYCHPENLLSYEPPGS